MNYAKGYEKWVEMTVQKQIDKAKSVAGKGKIYKITKRTCKRNQ